MGSVYGMFLLSLELGVLAAAYWYEKVSGLSVWVAHWPASLAGRMVSLRAALAVDRWVQDAFCFICLSWLAWFVAGDYLTEKWRREVALENKRWREGGD